MADYNQQFLEACRNGDMEETKRLVKDHQVDIHIQDDLAFKWACVNGHLEIAKWLVQNHQVDVHSNNEHAFRLTSETGKIDIAKWLVHDHQVDIRVNNEHAFKWAWYKEYVKIIEWLIEEYRYSGAPYYYYNKTVYILNHEPLNGWNSCTILDCPVIYWGILDEQAVIAYMAIIKKPKSARS